MNRNRKGRRKKVFYNHNELLLVTKFFKRPFGFRLIHVLNLKTISKHETLKITIFNGVCGRVVKKQDRHDLHSKF